MKKKTNYRWVIKIVITSFVVSVVFTSASAEILGSAGYIMAFIVLAVFITLGILFDIIGVAVTAAVSAPFHSMASHRERGATEAIRLLKNSEKVANFCNDVVGDISGIVSGSTAAIITAKLADDFSAGNMFWQLIISGLVAAVTIGGKAVGKTAAINNSTKIVLAVGKVISIKSKLALKR